MPRPRTSAFVGISLDGFLARPDGQIDWLDRYAGAEHGYAAFIDSVDMLLVGRKTYEFVLGMVAAVNTGPGMTDSILMRLRLSLPGSAVLGAALCVLALVTVLRAPRAAAPSSVKLLSFSALALSGHIGQRHRRRRPGYPRLPC